MASSNSMWWWQEAPKYETRRVVRQRKVPGSYRIEDIIQPVIVHKPQHEIAAEELDQDFTWTEAER